MPRIDPQQLLSCLNPLLASNGGVKSSAEVIRLASLMEKYSKKLVSKCIYIQILKCTETELLGQFMAAGGWNLVHFWLKDGSESSNWPLVQEILEMLLLCPVDGNRLKSNHTPKIVKNLSLNCSQNGVRILSNKLVEQWLKIAHQEKQQLQISPLKNENSVQQNGTPINGTTTHNNNINVDNDKKMLDDESLVIKKEENHNELQKDELNVTAEVSKKSSENVKYKISNRDTGLVLSIKRSISPSVDEKEIALKSPEAKVKSENKSKSSSSSSSSEKKKSSSSHKSSSSKSSQKDKERSSSAHRSGYSSSSSSTKDKHRSSSSSSKHSSSRDKDKSKDRDKPKKDVEKEQAEKDKETLSFLTPLSSHKLQRIPKRQNSETNENKDSNDLEPSAKAPKTSNEPVERKKPSISIEVRKGDKPKTVKTLNSQFRNHGLAEEPPPPPSRKALNKKTPPTTTATPALSVQTPSITTSSSHAKSSTSPPLNKKIEKALESEVPERAGGVKLIKPKPMLVETTGFLDAIEATILNKKEPKKRKRGSSTSSSKKDGPESPKIETKPLKFYKDTLEESAEDEKHNGTTSPSKEINGTSEVSKEGDENIKSSPKDEKESESKEEDLPEEKRPPGVGTGPDGPPGVLIDPTVPRRKRAKRSIRWRPDTQLTDVRYFELDENERVNVTKTFTEQKAMEHHAERNAFVLGRKMHDDVMVEQTKWRPLIVIENVPVINHGYKSREVEVQLEREKNTLQDLFYHQADTASEPDPEHFEPSDPIHIPIDDVTGNPDAVNSFREVAWPPPKPEIATLSNSNAFGGLFNNLSATLTIPAAPIIAVNTSAVNPLASINLGGMQSPWQHGIMPAVSVPFLQTPPPMIQNNYQSTQPVNFQGRNVFNGSAMNNAMDRNRVNPNTGGANWVRGNAPQQMRRGTCFQFQKTGFCRKRNNGCPYIHER